MLDMTNLAAGYGHGRSAMSVIRDITLSIAEGEAVAVIGESGSGKSTLARAIVGLAAIQAGQLSLDGSPISPHRSDAFRRDVQMVFQSPTSSLNPKMTIGDTLAEAIRCGHGKSDIAPRLARLIEATGIAQGWLTRAPRELSGGQLQRVAIARALAVEPRLLIADEITSALDLSVQAAILNMIADLRASRQLALLFITHDLAVARHVASTVVVMKAGAIVEAGPVNQVLSAPRHPYTAALIAAEPGNAAAWSHA
ncbi:MAG: ABC transporter ATP-binding protein [Arachidicoccus sp.]|nr:ABC transporter ATP-binding protein [Arachidicoccus sp.]